MFEQKAYAAWKILALVCDDCAEDYKESIYPGVLIRKECLMMLSEVYDSDNSMFDRILLVICLPEE